MRFLVHVAARAAYSIEFWRFSFERRADNVKESVRLNFSQYVTAISD